MTDLTDLTKILRRTQTTLDQLHADQRLACWETEFVRINNRGDHTFGHDQLDEWTRGGWAPFSTFVLDGTAYVAVRRCTNR